MTWLAPEKIDVTKLPSLPLEQRFTLPNVAAIYFVVDAYDTILYIGQTISLCYRWHSHNKLALFQSLSMLRIAYLTVSDTNVLYWLEKQAIYYYRPRYNERGKTALLPYKLRLPLPQEMRFALKQLAAEYGLSLQKLVIMLLEHAVQEPQSVLRPKRDPRDTATA